MSTYAYKVKVRHDKGTASFTLQPVCSREGAIQLTMELEHCSRRYILHCKRIKKLA